MLTVQLQETQDRLEDLMETTVKKECSHQFSQTEDTTDYKQLFSKVKQKIEELTKDSRLLLPTKETEPRAVQGEEKDVSEIIQPVELLIKELEQRNKERDELCSQVSGNNRFSGLLTWKLCRCAGTCARKSCFVFLIN